MNELEVLKKQILNLEDVVNLLKCRVELLGEFVNNDGRAVVHQTLSLKLGGIANDIGLRGVGKTFSIVEKAVEHSVKNEPYVLLVGKNAVKSLKHQYFNEIKQRRYQEVELSDLKMFEVEEFLKKDDIDPSTVVYVDGISDEEYQQVKDKYEIVRGFVRIYK